MSPKYDTPYGLPPAISRERLDQTLQGLGMLGFRHNSPAQKGLGFLGPLMRPDGTGYSTEVSVGVNLDGKEVEIPLLVPTLTTDEINWVLRAKGERVPPPILDKAIAHAKQRIVQSQSPFKE